MGGGFAVVVAVGYQLYLHVWCVWMGSGQSVLCSCSVFVFGCVGVPFCVFFVCFSMSLCDSMCVFVAGGTSPRCPRPVLCLSSCSGLSSPSFSSFVLPAGHRLGSVVVIGLVFD